jgi:hypothetical protein
MVLGLMQRVLSLDRRITLATAQLVSIPDVKSFLTDVSILCPHNIPTSGWRDARLHAELGRQNKLADLNVDKHAKPTLMKLRP